MNAPITNQLTAEQIGEQMYNYLKTSVQNTCKRSFPYHGKGVDMCQRCRLMILWEERNGGKSETLKLFEATFV